MNKHVVMHERGLDEPVVYCGRSMPGNSDAITLSRVVLGDDKAICKNCIKAVIRKLENK